LRAKHSNHLEGQVWSEFASEDRKKLGTGYYRVPSLLNVWAFAPFMHNNGMGPEVCSRAESSPHPEEKWYVSPYASGGTSNAPACVPYPVSVLERFDLFEKSLHELLTDPVARPRKMTLTDREIDYPLMGELALGARLKVAGAVLRLPAGLPVGLTGSFRHKEWASDFFLYMHDPDSFKRKADERFGKGAADELAPRFEGTKNLFLGKLDAASVEGVDFDRDHRRVLRAGLATTRLYFKYYSGCTAEIENAGHAFGLDIGKDPERMRALIAFLATL